jgi:hypothetical protein
MRGIAADPCLRVGCRGKPGGRTFFYAPPSGRAETCRQPSAAVGDVERQRPEPVAEGCRAQKRIAIAALPPFFQSNLLKQNGRALSGAAVWLIVHFASSRQSKYTHAAFYHPLATLVTGLGRSLRFFFFSPSFVPRLRSVDFPVGLAELSAPLQAVHQCRRLPLFGICSHGVISKALRREGLLKITTCDTGGSIATALTGARANFKNVRI